MIDLSLTDNLFIENELDAALQELDIIFNTENMELINNPMFGINFEQFLWTLTPSVSDMKKYITEKIQNTYYANKYFVSTNIEHMKGEYRSVYKVTLSLTNPNTGEIFTKKYQYQ